VVTHQVQVERRTGKVRRPETDVLPLCHATNWWGTGVVICLERGADLHMAQLMPLPLTVSCFSKIQIGFTFLVPAHLDSPKKGLLNECSKQVSKQVL